jgi:hypothetical protein
MNALSILRVAIIPIVFYFVLQVFFESNVRHVIEHHGWDTFFTRAIVKMRERKGFWFAFGIVLGAAVVAWVLPEMGTSKSALGLLFMALGAAAFVIGAYFVPGDAPSSGVDHAAPKQPGISATVVGGAGGGGGSGAGAVGGSATIGALPIVSPARPVTFYSRADKDKLGNLCRQLEELLLKNGGDGGGDGIYAKTAKFVNDWLAERHPGSGRAPDIAKLQADFEAASASSVSMNKALYDADGLVRASPSYSDELLFLLGDRDRKQIQELQIATNALGESIQALALASKYNDPRLLERIFNSSAAARDNLLAVMSRFQQWEFGAVQRIKQFRVSLSE